MPHENHPPAQLQWTSPEDLIKTLWRLSHKHNSHRLKASMLATSHLLDLVNSTLAPDLKATALDLKYSPNVRNSALAMLPQFGASLDEHETSALLDEWDQVELLNKEEPIFKKHPSIDAVHILRALRGDPACARAILWVNNLGNDSLHSLIDDLCDYDPPHEHKLLEWSLSLWLSKIEADPSKEDLQTARSIAQDQPDAAYKVLQKHWALHPPKTEDWSTHGEALASDLKNFPKLNQFLTPSQHKIAAQHLLLPLSAILEILGPIKLTQQIRSAILNHSFELRSRSYFKHHQSKTSNAFKLLHEWNEGPKIALGLLVKTVLHPKIRAKMILLLLDTHFRPTLTYLTHHIEESHNLQAILETLDFLLQITPYKEKNHPQKYSRKKADFHSAEVEQFIQAVKTLDDLNAQIRLLTLRELRGEDTPSWRAQLREWQKHPNPLIKTRAQGALAKRGDQASIQALHKAASVPDELIQAIKEREIFNSKPTPTTREEHKQRHTAWLKLKHTFSNPAAIASSEVRAEALHQLGSLPNAISFLPLFERALRFEGIQNDHATSPAREHAALIVACIAPLDIARNLLLNTLMIADINTSFYFIISLFCDLIEYSSASNTTIPRLKLLETTKDNFHLS